MVEWFGYKLHLLVDVKHEVVLAYDVTDTKAGDGETLPALLEQAEANLPRGSDQDLGLRQGGRRRGGARAALHGEGIKPLIQIRALWKEEPERLLPGHDGTLERGLRRGGTIYCYDKVSEPPVRHKMSYIGHEPERETLKYRCPAQARGLGVPDVGDVQRGRSRTARRCGCRARSTCGGSRRCRARPRSSSGCTRAGRRWSGSTPG